MNIKEKENLKDKLNLLLKLEIASGVIEGVTDMLREATSKLREECRKELPEKLETGGQEEKK